MLRIRRCIFEEFGGGATFSKIKGGRKIISMFVYVQSFSDKEKYSK